MSALKQSEEKFPYTERIHSTGRPRMINFRHRHRRIRRVWTYDRDMDFTWTPECVFINGPTGTEVHVEYEII